MSVNKITTLLIICSFQFEEAHTKGFEGCPGNWKMGSSLCYLFEIEKTLNWHHASKYCEEKGARLAEPVNNAENKEILQYINRIGCMTAYWIGLERGKDGKFHLSSNKKPVLFTDWDKSQNQPDNFKNRENCAQIQCSSRRWNDDRCSFKRGFICQKQVASSAASTSPVMTSSTSTPSTPTTNTRSFDSSYQSTSAIMTFYNKTDEIETSTMTPTARNVTMAESKGHRPFLLSFATMAWTTIGLFVKCFVY